MTALPPELTGTWTIDPEHSTVGFAVRHAMVATVRGHFTSFTGGGVIDAANPETASPVDIDATSISTGNEQRDQHLRSVDFFRAEEHPTIRFRSTGLELDGDGAILTGDLTIGGVTHPLDITWEFGGIAKDPWGTVKAGFEGTTTVSRKDWGLEWNAPLEAGGVLVADKVKLVLEIEASRQEQA